MSEITDHQFLGKREWGINPPADAPCQFPVNMRVAKLGQPIESEPCGAPRSVHAIMCPSVLMIAGKDYRCDVCAPHEGWAHGNKEAQAIWGDNDNRRIGRETHLNAAQKPIEIPAVVDPAIALRDFTVWLMQEGVAFHIPDESFPISKMIDRYIEQKGS